ncbi:MAG: hypothetical protein ACLUD1_09665, partial [Clostridia bacterium]
EITVINIVKEDNKYIIYKNKDNMKMFYNNEMITNQDIITKIDINPNNKTLITPNIGTALSVKISTERCNGKECYLIESYDNVKVWVEKETGLVIREMSIISYDNGEFNVVTDYLYDFNNVTDEQVAEPSI